MVLDIFEKFSSDESDAIVLDVFKIICCHILKGVGDGALREGEEGRVSLPRN